MSDVNRDSRKLSYIKKVVYELRKERYPNEQLSNELINRLYDYAEIILGYYEVEKFDKAIEYCKIIYLGLLFSGVKELKGLFLCAFYEITHRINKKYYQEYFHTDHPGISVDIDYAKKEFNRINNTLYQQKTEMNK